MSGQPASTPMLVIVRMPQDTTFHLAERTLANVMHTTAKAAPMRDLHWFGTVTLCGTQIHAKTGLYRPASVAKYPVYRGKNEFHKCPRCTDAATALLFPETASS